MQNNFISNYSRLVFLCLIIFLINDLGVARSPGIDSVAKFIYADSVDTEQRFNRIFDNRFWNGKAPTEQDLIEIEKLITDHSELVPSADNRFLLALFHTRIAKIKGNIGKALVVADEFHKQTLKSKLPNELRQSYLLYHIVYRDFGMEKESIKYWIRSYFQFVNYATADEVKGMNYSIAWMYYRYGKVSSNTTYFDSAAYYMSEFVKFKTTNEINNPLVEPRKITMMALLSGKRYNETIQKAYEALRVIEKIPLDKWDNWVHYSYTRYISYLGSSYARLGNRDSAYKYMNHSALFNLKDTNGLYFPEKKKWLGQEDLLERVINFIKLKEEQNASDLVYLALYGPNKLKDTEIIYYLYRYGAPIFEKTGRYKEAAMCYKLFTQRNDSTQKEELKLRAMTDSINTAIQIENAKTEALLRQEQAELKTEKEKEKQVIILTTSIIILFVVVIFSFIVFRRYKEAKKQARLIEIQNQKIAQKQKEVMDSINYAKRIQLTLMPSDRFIEKIMARIKNKS